MHTEPAGTLAEQAGYWVWRRNTERWTDAEQRALEQWLAQDPRHADAYAKAEQLWRQLDQFDSTQLSRSPRSAVHPALSRPHQWLGLATAACILALVFPTVVSTIRKTETTYRTRQGKEQQVAMPDGSSIHLNTGTELTFTTTISETHVQLLRGEAYFKVQHDPKRAFVIEASGSRIVDIGTAFNVHLADDRVDVTVTEGELQMESAAKHAKATLRAGQSIAYITESDRLLPVSDASKSPLSGWWQGRLHLRMATLETLFSELERYHSIRTVFTDASLRQLQVTGSFDPHDLSLLLRTLEATLPLQAERHPDGRIVLRRR